MEATPTKGSRAIRYCVLTLLTFVWINGCRTVEIPAQVAESKNVHLDQIDDVVLSAIQSQIFPGAVVHVIHNDKTVFHKAFGYFDYSESQRVDTNSVFDLASITKVMATTLAIMGLHESGELNIYDPVSKYISEYDTPEKRAITIHQLLTHEAGLPAFRIYVDEIQNRDALIEAIKHEPLIQPPGESYLYSDLGLILCGVIIEEITGQRLDKYLSERWYTKLKMMDTHFNPSSHGSVFSNRILPTEIDTVYRHKLIQSEVHDERAWYMDGVAGHAGLFSTSTDIARFARLLLNKGILDDTRYLSEETIELFIRRQTPINRRGIGFDLKSLEGFSSAGSLASTSTFGHTGFTGTSVWMDPERNLAVIILTNRTYPYRGSATGIARVRSEIGDLVQEYISQ